MKTLLITPDLFGSEGGIARIMRLYLRALGEFAGPADTLRSCTLLDAGDPAARARAVGGPRLRSHRHSNGSRLRFTGQVLQAALDTDLLISGHLHFLPLAWIASRFQPRLRYCLVAHGIEVWRPFSWIERLALSGAERIFCVSDYTRRQMLRFHPGLDPRRLVVVPNTFDPQFSGAETHTPTTPAGSPTGPRILVVSRLLSSDPYKGVDTVIEAMPRILETHPGATLRIVGGGDDRPRLESLAIERNLGAAVNFLGAVDDATLRDEYRHCDLFALPSRKEGFGLVYLEAMTYGKPCIAARAGGAPEVVNRTVGELVDYGATDQIAAAVHALVRHPRDPAALRAHAAEFSFPRFRTRLAAELQTIAVARDDHGVPVV